MILCFLLLFSHLHPHREGIIRKNIICVFSYYSPTLALNVGGGGNNKRKGVRVGVRGIIRENNVRMRVGGIIRENTICVFSYYSLTLI
jgi:hypothetical protein